MTRPTDAEVRETIERLREHTRDPDVISPSPVMMEAADMLEALTAQETQNE